MLLKHLTKHAVQRIQQRGKSKEGVKMVLRYGVRYRSQDGTFLRRKEAAKEMERRKKWLSRLEKYSGKRHIIKAMRKRLQTIERMRGCVVVEKNGQVITVFDRRKRLRG